MKFAGVLFEVEISTESFAASRAREGFAILMCVHVECEVIDLMKRLRAHLTQCKHDRNYLSSINIDRFEKFAESITTVSVMLQCMSINLHCLFIYYLFISKFSIQQYNSKIVKYTIQFKHTWILKDEQVATYIAPEKRNKRNICSVS